MVTRRGVGVAAAATALTAAISADSWASAAATTAGQAVVAPGGLIRIGRDTTVAADMTLMPGTSFAIDAGVTLTFTGDLVAPAGALFTGPGRVDLTHSRVVAARPEWWGAVADDPAIDCGPALQACLAAHLAMQLGVGDYHLADTLHIDLPNRRLWGVGRSKGFRGTRLVRRGERGAVVVVGTATPPATVNGFVWGIDMRWIALARDIAPEPSDAAAGLEIRHVVDCVFEGVRADEHTIGFSIQGAVRTFLRDCSAFRSVPGHGGHFVGFDMDGRVPAAAIATGANASIYLVDCLVRTGDQPLLALSIGCRLTGAFSDTFVERLETTEVGVGIFVDGRHASLNARQQRAGQVDLHIRGAVLDQCGDAGIRLSGLSEAALVDIDDPYVALAPAGTVALDVADSGGNIGVRGGQLIGWTAPGPATTGIRLRATSGVAIGGTKLVGFARPIDAAATTAFDIAVGINHRGPSTTGPAIRLAACSHGHLRPQISGMAKAFDTGIVADEDCDAVDILTAAIVPASLASGNMVQIDGRSIAPQSPGRIYLVAQPAVASSSVGHLDDRPS